MIEEILMIPGPTMLAPQVREAMARPQMSHADPEFVKIFSEALELTKYAFKAEKGYPFVLTASGTAAMEAAVSSLIEPGEPILVLETGYFGRRFSAVGEALGADVHTLSFPFGDRVDPGAVDRELSERPVKAVFVTHVDTSSSVLNPLSETVRVARKHGALSVIDSVCGLGGCELDFDGLGADVALTASQKALAAPPGLSLLVFSKRALEVVESRRTPIRTYYTNILTWKRIMEDPGRYFATPAVQLICALREALRIVKEEGLEKRWFRHRVLAEAFKAGVQSLGLGFIAREDARAETLTGVYIPGDRAAEVQAMMKAKFGVHVALALEDLKTKALRIAHLGNISPKEIIAALTALGISLKHIGLDVKPEEAVAAAEPHLTKLTTG